MASSVQTAVTQAVGQVKDQFSKLTPNQQYAVAIAGGLSTVYLLSQLGGKREASSASKPSSFELTGGSIAKGNVKKEFQAYAASFGKEAGDGIVDRSKTVHLVDVFYSLVTDMYEWGWGQSFHFSPKLPGKDLRSSEAAHEARIAATLNLAPGMKCLDCGCGVGGPMRTIASTSGAHVTGITINEYQVSRAKHHNKQQNVSDLTNVVRGDFLNMPFESRTFDAAYAIEATCHAPQLELVYAEIYRVLKPGALFVSYEWVSTSDFNRSDPEHVKIIDEINFGNGLPEMRTWLEAETAGKFVGFELVNSLDLATCSSVAGPWWDRLKMGKYTHQCNQAIVNTLDFFGIAPAGLKEVHHMLVDVAKSLVRGGETNVFSPMHFLVFRKPLDATN
ncbi:MAG: hypothetical protein WDW38_000551 [Sanguina aurantia]